MLASSLDAAATDILSLFLSSYILHFTQIVQQFQQVLVHGIFALYVLITRDHSFPRQIFPNSAGPASMPNSAAHRGKFTTYST